MILRVCDLIDYSNEWLIMNVCRDKRQRHEKGNMDIYFVYIMWFDFMWAVTGIFFLNNC